MRLTKQDMNRYFYEYEFWNVVNQNNEEAVKNNLRDGIIHTSQARQLRKNLTDTLAREYKTDIDHATISQFKNAMNITFLDKIVYDSFPFGDDENDQAKFKADLNTYMDMIGYKTAQNLGNGQYEMKGKNVYLPISPYDTRFSRLGTVLNNGSRLGGISANQDFDAGKLNRVNTARNAQFFNNLRITDDNNFVASPAHTGLFTVDDVSGMSRLKLWMTDEEYRNVRDYVNSAVDLDHLTNEDFKTYREMTDKAVYLLRGLKKEGYNYSIVKDANLGQIKAKIENTKVDVRLTDSPKNSDYIGRVYDNGMSGTYNATRRDVGTGTYKVNPTPEQVLDLVNFALGRTVYVRNSKNEPSNLKVGQDVLLKRVIRGKMTPYHATYHPAGNLTAISGPYMIDGKPDEYHNAVRMIFNTSSRQRTTTYMADGDEAENYIRSAVESASNNFKDKIDVEKLIQDAQDHQDDPDFVPDFSTDPVINDIQNDIWNALTAKVNDGEKNIILKPGVDSEEFMDAVAKFNEEHSDYTADEFNKAMEKYQYNNELSPADMARLYAQDNVKYYIGQFDLDQDNKRFDPANVAKYQVSKYGIYRNNEDMIKALRMANIDADQLKGNSDNLNQINNNLVKFDQGSAKKLDGMPKSTFLGDVYNTLYDALETNGVNPDPESIKIDKNGIISYSGTMNTHEGLVSRKGENYEAKQIHGQIGQVFVPEENGVVYTKFAGDNNYAFIPGYRAEILPQEDGQDLSVEERTRLTGYKQQLLKNIQYQVRQDLLLNDKETEAGSPTNINNTYRQIYAERKDLDFIDKYKEQGMPDHVLDAMIRSESQKVRYNNIIRDNSTVNAEYRAEKYGVDVANDNNLDAYNLTGNRNMSLLTKESDGYFDPIASNATTTNQGIAKFLASGARVDNDGKIIKGPTEGPGSRTALMNIPEAQFMDYDPFDRQNMTISNWLQAERVTPDVNVSQMTFGGWNQDDGVVVSKKFADEYKLRDSIGQMRSLTIGDKISDFNGNKGVINLIVDPEMPKEEAEKQGLTKEVEWFKNNPKMDIVMAPFPAVSRYNGGTARQLMREPEDLVDLNGKTIKGAMGKMPMIITDKAADVKTKIYDTDDIRQGKGRKVSAQLAWSLAAKDATNILHEAYGRNGSALSNLTEYMNVMGLDVDEYGNFKNKLSDKTVMARNKIEQPEIIRTKTGRVDYNATENGLAEKLNKSGGMMELPFEIKLANGQKTNNVPVMSAFLRSGQELEDGELIVHDYTHQYESMYRNGIKYRDCQNTIDELSKLPSLSQSDSRKLERAKRGVFDSQAKAQDAYNSIANSVKSRVFEGKHNIFRDKIMAHRMPKSATSIWTADPRLGIDELKMGQGMAEQLGLKTGDKTLIWRDPALRDGSTRYMRVSVDPKLTGVAINPSMDKSFDGDFDGDTVGIVALSTKAAKKEAEAKFGVKNNLLDYGSKGADGKYPLYMQHSLDIMVAENRDPSLNKRWNELTEEVNKFEKDFTDVKQKHEQKLVSDTDFDKAQKLLDIKRSQAVNKINDYYQDCYKTVGDAHIKYDSLENHLRSVKEACLDTGAKGSISKFADYAQWLGAKVNIDKKGNVDFSTVQDAGHTLSTRDMQIETMKATAIKSFGTGVAGAFSQRGIKAFRNVDPKAILELTYPVTQSVLQVKHDPVEAVKKYDMLMGPARDIWRGYDMHKDSDGWHVNYDSDHKPIMADSESWQKNFIKMYKEDLNVDPNPDYVRNVANALSENGIMQGVENAKTISLMDKLAYNGKFEDVVAAANENQNLFKGKYNASFAPDKLIENVNLAKYQKERQAQVQQDLQAGRATTFMPDDHKEAKRFVKQDTLMKDRPVVRSTNHVIRETVSISPIDAPEAKEDTNNGIEMG